MRRCVEAKAKKESLVPPGASMHSHFIVFSKTSHLFGIVDNMTCLVSILEQLQLQHQIHEKINGTTIGHHHLLLAFLM